MAELKVDREALKGIVTSLRKVEAEWCVACGAGAASAKLDFPAETVQRFGAQLLDPAALREFINTVHGSSIAKDQDWCVACGAGAAASPLRQEGDPAVTDAEIDRLSSKLLSAIKGG